MPLRNRDLAAAPRNWGGGTPMKKEAVEPMNDPEIVGSWSKGHTMSHGHFVSMRCNKTWTNLKINFFRNTLARGSKEAHSSNTFSSYVYKPWKSATPSFHTTWGVPLDDVFKPKLSKKTGV